MKRLPQTHLVGEDAVDAILVETDHPIEASHLVIPHGAILDVRRRVLEASYHFAGLVRLREKLLVFLLLRHSMPVAVEEGGLVSRALGSPDTLFICAQISFVVA